MTGDDVLLFLAAPEASRTLTLVDGLLLVALLATCGVIVVVDARQRIIPDACNVVVAILGLAFAGREGSAGLLAAAVQGGVALLAFWAFRSLYRGLRGRHGLGLGDVKFLGAAGTWIGLGGLPPLVLVACGAALAFLGVVRLRGRAVTASLALPFGPFLVAGLLGGLAMRFG